MTAFANDPGRETTSTIGAASPLLMRDRLGLRFWIPPTWIAMVVVLAVTANLLPLRSPIETDFYGDLQLAG